MAKVKRPAWSFSSFKTFEGCPRKYYHTKVVKDYQENFDTPAIKYGNEFHKAAELYIKSNKPLEPRFEFAKPSLDKLNSMGGKKLCEFKMALTENLEPCTYFAQDVWFRGVADLLIVDADTGVAKVIDYKTGGNTSYADGRQLELMALAIFKHFPEVTTVKAGLLFVVANAFIKDEFTIDREGEMWKRWFAHYEDLITAYKTGVWNPIKTGLCKNHCIVMSCAHNGRRGD